MSNPFVRSALRQVKSTLPRFLSILLITLIGVMFFSGLRLTGPYMKDSAERWFDQQNFMDVQIVSTLGFDADDLAAIRATPGVLQVAPTYTANLLVKRSGLEMSIQILSLDTASSHPINAPELLSGRLPVKDNECVAESSWLRATGGELGDTVRFYSGSNKPLSDTLRHETFTIVGVVKSPLFIAADRGNSDIGTGFNRYFFYTLPEAFNLEVYTAVYLQVDLGAAGDASRFDDVYFDAVAPTVEALKETGKTRSAERFNAILADAHAELADARAEVADGYQKLADAEQEFAYALVFLEASYHASLVYAFEREREDALADLEQAEADIAQAEADLEELEEARWYVLDLKQNPGFRSYLQQSGQMEDLAVVIPLLFFLIAALVSMTSMTRLVDSDRTIIGTYKALGYTNRAITARYLLYASSATIVGGISGTIIGANLFPPLIFNAFRTMYTVPPGPMLFSWSLALLALLFALICTVGPALLVCLGILRETPASAMRPLAPRPGKRIFLERIKPLWRRLTFLHKITSRNLLRYKKRAFMTIFGVAGCTALLFTGFALNDSLATIGPKQYGNIEVFDVAITFKPSASAEELESFFTLIEESPELATYTLVRRETAEILHGGFALDLALIATDNPAELPEYYHSQPRIGGLFSEALALVLDDEGVFITEQIARQVGAEVGSTITLRNLSDEEADFVVAGIRENYVYHYVMMTAAAYEQGFNKEYQPNQILGHFNTGYEAMPESLTALSAVSGLYYTQTSADDFATITDVLGFVMVILTLSAAALLFVVLFSLNTINREERTRELASIKVLGFFNRELASYIYREGLILTLLGIAIGIVQGIALQRYIISTIEVDVFMFSRDLLFSTFFFSIFLTIVFAFVVNLLLYRPLTRIDMVAALKAIE
ncbi:MAG: ABC transporter permease [Coriobacteriia bacterium]|nr:ABC transporter permease [Coriobacteriia bacterium]